jgi:hypothetical protein
MQNPELAILYEPDRGRPLTVARVSDRNLLVAAAEAAIAEAEDRARALAEADEFLGAVQREEAARMRRVLGIFLPELRPPEPRLEVIAGNGRSGPDATDAPSD